MKYRIVLATLVSILSLAACQFATQTPTPTAVPPTTTLEATATPKPTSTLTPTVAPTPTLSILRPATRLLTENFSKWDGRGYDIYRGDWNVVNDGTGNRVLETISDPNAGSDKWPEIGFGDPNWRDYTIDFRYRVLEYDKHAEGAGLVFLEFRHGPQAVYILTLSASSGWVALVYGTAKGWADIDAPGASAVFPVDLRAWHTIHVEAYQYHITASVDKTPVIDVIDSRVKKGAISLGIGSGTTIQFDDFELTALLP